MNRGSKNNRSVFAVILLITVVIVAFTAVLITSGAIGKFKEKEIPVIEPVSSEQELVTPPEPEPPTSKDSMVRLIGVGDNLIHDGLYLQAQRRAGGVGYNFGFAYENVAKVIESADIASINQETIVADIYEPSAYPMFNSPNELGEEMVKIGFDVFNLANNHALDKGTSGLLRAMDFWTEQGIKYTGAYKDQEDFEAIRTVTKNDITFAFIGMTELTNGLSLPSGSEVKLNRLADMEMIEQRIKMAKEISDVVVVNVHWGVEYTHEPNKTQTAMAQKMVEWGADIIFGHHPHVIQPIEYITRADGTKGLVAYSLGNFISTQSYGPRMVGGMLDITLTKNGETGVVDFTDVKFEGVITHYGNNFGNCRNYFRSDYTAELADIHGCKEKTPEFNIEYIDNMINSVIDSQFLS